MTHTLTDSDLMYGNSENLRSHNVSDDYLKFTAYAQNVIYLVILTLYKIISRVVVTVTCCTVRFLVVIFVEIN